MPQTKVLQAIKTAAPSSEWSKADAERLVSLEEQLIDTRRDMDMSPQKKAETVKRVQAEIASLRAKRDASTKAAMKEASGPLQKVTKSQADIEREKRAAAANPIGTAHGRRK